MMKALTVWQPWASLIMIGAKPNEFRKWDYRLRQNLAGQRIVIHAGQRPVRPAEVMSLLEGCKKGRGSLINDIAIPFLERLAAAHKCAGVIETSAALGTVTLGQAFKVERFEPDSDRVSHHLYAWPMINPVPFKAPVLCPGMQGFWNYSGEIDNGPGTAGVPPPPPFSLDAVDPGRDGDREAR